MSATDVQVEQPPRSSEAPTDMVVGLASALGLSVLLFVLPVVGPLVAGAVGGRRAGGRVSAILVGLVAGLFAANVVLLTGAMLLAVPLLPDFAALGTGTIAWTQAIAVLVGAVIGGFTAPAQRGVTRRDVLLASLCTALLVFGLDIYGRDGADVPRADADARAADSTRVVGAAAPVR